MALKKAAAISRVIIVAGIVWKISNLVKQKSAEDTAYVDEVMPKGNEMGQELSKLLDEMSDKIVILREELKNRNRQINNLNQQLEGLKTILPARKT